MCSARLISIAMLLLGLACASAPPPRPSGGPSGPNIVMIVADDQAWTDFGFMGHPIVETPNLGRLAAEGALFENGYVPTSLCRASLATLLTGLYAHQHHICCNDPPEGVEREAMLPFLREAPTLPRLLGERGYLSFQSGKFWEGHFANGGFTHGMTLDRLGGRHGDRGLAIGRRTLRPIFDFLDRVGERPFFLWYAPLMPHLPHDPPRWILERYQVLDLAPELARYYGMITWLDRTVGQLLRALDERGLAADTLVVFVVDNGWLPAEGMGRRAGTRSKLSPYDAGVRTPILLHWPGRVPPGRHPEPVSTIDLAPTLLSAAGLAPTERMPGHDLLPLARGETPLEREAVFGEIYVHRARTLEHVAHNLTHRWLRRGRHKLIVPAAPEASAELYDLAADPHETADLAAARPDLVHELRQLLDAWWLGH